MAKYEAQLHGNFAEILDAVDSAIMNNSSSASLEDSSDFSVGGTRCAVRVYERYSYTGGNRVSLNFTLLEIDGQIFASVITSGGSQAMFLKINTFGEKSFLDLVTSTLDSYRI